MNNKTAQAGPSFGKSIMYLFILILIIVLIAFALKQGSLQWLSGSTKNFTLP